MARVPFQGTPEVGESASSLGRETIRATPEDFGADIGKGLEGLGQEFTQRGDLLANYAMKYQEQQNQISVDSAYINLMKGGNDIKLKLSGLEGMDAVNALPGAMTDLETLRSNLGSGLNRAARIIFDSDSRRLTAMLTAGMADHAAQQQNIYSKNLQDGVVQGAVQSAAINWDHPQAIAIAQADAMNAMAEKYRGHPDSEIKFRQLEATSAIQSAVIDQMLPKDAFAAERYYHEHMDQLLPAQINAYAAKFGAVLHPIEGFNIAQGIVNGTATPLKSDDATNLVLGVGENYGKPREQWSRAISSAGAMGLGQIKPDTAAGWAKDLGIPFNPNNPDDIHRLQTDDKFNLQLASYGINKLMRQYNGNAILAGMAYNTGAGNMDWYLKNVGNPLTGQISFDDFIAGVRASGHPGSKEVSAYGQRLLAALPAKAVAGPTNEDPRVHLADWLSQADEAAQGNPELARTIRSNIITQVNQLHEMQAATQRQGIGAIMDVVQGGQNFDQLKPTSLPQLWQMHPELQSVYAGLNPKQRAGVEHALMQNYNGVGVEPSQASMTRMQVLGGEARTDPAKFMHEDFNDYPELPYADRQRLRGIQRDMMTKPLPAEDINGAIHDLKTFGVWSGVPTDKEGHDRFVGALDQEIKQFALDHGRKPTPDDIRQIGQRLLMPDPASDTNFHTGQAFEREYARDIARVPDKDRQQITQLFAERNNGRQPTVGQIVYFYTLKHPHGRE